MICSSQEDVRFLRGKCLLFKVEIAFRFAYAATESSLRPYGSAPHNWQAAPRLEPQLVPHRPGFGKMRLLRGGTWSNPARYSRLAVRTRTACRARATASRLAPSCRSQGMRLLASGAMAQEVARDIIPEGGEHGSKP